MHTGPDGHEHGQRTNVAVVRQCAFLWMLELIGTNMRSPAHTPWARELQRGTVARSARYPPPFSSSFPAPGQIVAGRPGNAGACVLGYFLFPPSHPHSWHGPAGYKYRTWNKGYKYRTATHITVARSTTINWDVSARTWKGCPRPGKGDGHAQAGRSPTGLTCRPSSPSCCPACAQPRGRLNQDG